MATQILAPGVSVATSSDVTVAAGATEILSLYCATAAIPQDCVFTILQDNPGTTDTPVGRLDFSRPSVVVEGPGVYRVRRDFAGAAGTSVGVCTGT